LGFTTLITPTKESIRKHQISIKEVIRGHITAPQESLIKKLNPIIRGWSNYYKNSDIKNVGESSKQDNLMYLKLRRWGYRRCLSINKAHNIYWHTIGNNKWAFSVKAKNGYLRLVSHIEVECSSTKYVKVKGDRSPYDGDAVYWSSRMGRHPEIANRVAILLKKQKGKCAHCGLYFRDGDIFEIDHIIPKSKGGKDNYQNLQLLHGHCHDSKTANDGSLKPKHGICNE
jgi:RNA-directed DNA polymerase